MIDNETIHKEVKDCSKKLGLTSLKISVLIVKRPAKERAGNLELEGDIYARLLPLREGYKIRFNLTTINDNKFDRKQLRGLILHELTHILRHEYAKFIRGRDKIAYSEFIKANQNYRYWHGSSIIPDLNDLEELLLDIFVARLCVMEGFSWDKPITDEKGNRLDFKKFLSKSAKEIYQNLQEKIEAINGDD